jgi:hypothetical protein
MTAQAALFHDVAPYGFDSGATFSPDRLHRYRLWRAWGDRENRLVVAGINPSKAGEEDNDPTVTKLVGFGQRWGFGALDVVNPFAFVSTDQRGLLTAADPIGPDNDHILTETFAGARRIVWAWGRGKTAGVQRLLLARLESPEWRALNRSIRCEVGTLGVTVDGFPRHPLMLAYSTQFVRERGART